MSKKNINVTTFAKLQEIAREIKYGEFPVILVIFNGRIVGFDKKDPSVKRFREESFNKPK